jgi:hypothetical protein
MQMAGLPNLTIAHSGNSVIVSWPSTGSYTLQQNANLAPANWTTNTSWTTSNGTNYLNLTNPVGNLFFRLAK